MTILIGAAAPMLLPQSPSTSTWLTERERFIAVVSLFNCRPPFLSLIVSLTGTTPPRTKLRRESQTHPHPPRNPQHQQHDMRARLLLHQHYHPRSQRLPSHDIGPNGLDVYRSATPQCTDIRLRGFRRDRRFLGVRQDRSKGSFPGRKPSSVNYWIWIVEME